MSMQPDMHSGRLWVEAGEPRVGVVAEVAPTLNIHRTYSFAVPDDLAAHIALGQRAAHRARQGSTFRRRLCCRAGRAPLGQHAASDLRRGGR